jgi:hypothetical protein
MAAHDECNEGSRIECAAVSCAWAKVTACSTPCHLHRVDVRTREQEANWLENFPPDTFVPVWIKAGASLRTSRRCPCKPE